MDDITVYEFLSKSVDEFAIKAHVDRARAITLLTDVFDESRLQVVQRGAFLQVSVVGQEVDAALDGLRLRPEIVIGTHVYHTSARQSPLIPTGELTLVLEPGLPREFAITQLEFVGARFLQDIADGIILASVTSDSVNPVKLCIELERIDGIKEAQPSLSVEPEFLALPREDMLEPHWHLRNLGFHRTTSKNLKPAADSRVVDAWEHLNSLGRRDITIAVIDDWFELSHPDLPVPQDQVAPYGLDSQPFGDSRHGTACAGIALGRCKTIGALGPSPNAKLLPIGIGGSDINPQNVRAWFDHAVENKADIISCSWMAKTPYFQLTKEMEKAIEEAACHGRDNKGCVILFAAGNQNVPINHASNLNGFAAHPSVITVAACNSLDKKSHYSAYGPEVHICAQSDGTSGMGVLTADLLSKPGYSTLDHTSDFGGTSAACALVAGICGLILSVAPGLTSAQVKDVLAASARKIGHPSEYAGGRSDHYGFGSVDALEAVKEALRVALR